MIRAYSRVAKTRYFVWRSRSIFWTPKNTVRTNHGREVALGKDEGPGRGLDGPLWTRVIGLSPESFPFSPLPTKYRNTSLSVIMPTNRPLLDATSPTVSPSTTTTLCTLIVLRNSSNFPRESEPVQVTAPWNSGERRERAERMDRSS
jgi:hypothetical protein